MFQKMELVFFNIDTVVHYSLQIDFNHILKFEYFHWCRSDRSFSTVLYVQFITAVGAGLIDYIISTFAVGYAIALDTGQEFSDVWNEKFRWMTPFYAAFGVVSFLFVLAFSIAGHIGAFAVNFNAQVKPRFRGDNRGCMPGPATYINNKV